MRTSTVWSISPSFARAFAKLPVINVAKIIIDATIAAGGNKALVPTTPTSSSSCTIRVIRNQTAQRGVDGQFTLPRQT